MEGDPHAATAQLSGDLVMGKRLANHGDAREVRLKKRDAGRKCNLHSLLCDTLALIGRFPKWRLGQSDV